MMDPEGGVLGRGEEVGPDLADGEVAPGMEADVVGARGAVHEGLEDGEVGLREHVVDEGLVGVFLGDGRVDVAFQALRDRAVGVHPRREDAGALEDDVDVVGAHGADEVGEVGVVFEAAAAGAVGEGVVGAEDDGAVVDVDAVAAEGVGPAVEDGACLRGVGPFGPVPVGHGAGVAAFVAHFALEDADEVAVPGEEEGADVDVERHFDVHDAEVEEAVPGAGVLVLVELGRLLPEAFNRFYVGCSLGLRRVAPEDSLSVCQFTYRGFDVEE